MTIFEAKLILFLEKTRETILTFIKESNGMIDFYLSLIPAIFDAL